MDEIALIKLAKKGDLDAFNRLVIAYQDTVFNLAYRMLHNDPAAQDATQDAFISAYEKLNAYRGGSFKAWILRIVANKCYDELRRWKRRPETNLYPSNPENEEEVEDPVWLADDNQSPEDGIEQKELEEVIQGCIDALPDEYKAVVILVDMQGLDYKNASGIVESPIGTIRSRLARARKRLQDCLRGFLELLPDKFRLNYESRPK
jgi:RNA polymerase sigma-70 factor (ECF subfamily)